MRVIAIGDPHFRVENILEVETFMDKMAKLAKTEKPDMIVVLGDLLHTHEKIFTIALNKAYDFIKTMRDIAPTYVLVGNHDYIQNSQFLTENHWMNAMKDWDNVIVVDSVISVEKQGLKFVLLPYVPNGRFQEALNTIDDEWKNADCIFAHQEFSGCKMGAIISVEGDIWPEEYPCIVSGHIHSRQTPQPNIYYTGSAMQHAFGESDKNTIPIFDFTPEKPYNLREIDLELPRKRIVYMDMDNIDDFAPKETEDQVKITLTGNYDEFKTFKKSEKYKELTKNGTKVVFKTKKVKETDKPDFQETNTSDFRDILYNLVIDTRDETLLEFYELVINNRKFDKDIILI
jgi:DNA repair exonuclease SbcCD nuclease subunit